MATHPTDAFAFVLIIYALRLTFVHLDRFAGVCQYLLAPFTYTALQNPWVVGPLFQMRDTFSVRFWRYTAWLFPSRFPFLFFSGYPRCLLTDVIHLLP
jgi:hypothetical protein